MKKKLLGFLIVVLLITLISIGHLAEQSKSLNVSSDRTLIEDVTEFAVALNSTPIPLNDGSFFVFDNRETIQRKAEDELNLAVKLGIIDPNSSGTIRYVYIFKDFDLPTPKGSNCVLRSISNVKVLYDNNEYRFLECQSVNWQTLGCSLNPSSGNYNISEDGRYLEISGAFNVVTYAPYFASASYVATGWSIDGRVGSKLIARRWVTQRYTLDGNYIDVVLDYPYMRCSLN